MRPGPLGNIAPARFRPERITQILFALLLAAIIAVSWQAWLTLQHDLTVTFLDVGQGDCILIHSPAGRNILIDGGGRAGHATGQNNLGHWVVVPALYRQGIRRLDAIILTHPHEDHVGGLAEVVEEVPVGMILDSGQELSTPAYSDFLRAAKTHNIKIVQARAGQMFNLGNDITAAVLHPQAILLQGTGDDFNNNSVVIRLNDGRISFLLPGDLQSEGEEEILSGGGDLASAVLKVGHHGSVDATSEKFLEAVKPHWAVISVGENNPFGHPHQETLERLKANKVRVLRTDTDGTIVMNTDGRQLTVEWGRDRRQRETEEF